VHLVGYFPYVLTNVVEEIKKKLILCSKPLVENLVVYVTYGECGTARKATDINKIQRNHMAFFVSKAANTHS
jgi:hypothetical protein